MASREKSQKGPHMKKQVVEQQRPNYGLRNHGNTCYLNSVLQVLYMTPEVHDSLCPDHLTESLDSDLMKLFKDLRIKTSGTEAITSKLGIRNVYEQRDAAACLELILQKLSTEVSKLFQGKLTYTTKCTKGHVINEETNSFWTFPLSLRDSDDKTYSVEEGLNRHLHPKSYSVDNMVYCNTCEKKTEANRTCEMVQSPQILILLLKRFQPGHHTMSHVKSDCYVDVPETLQVETKTKENKQYQLYGMVDHMGSLKYGHYTATIKSREDETWFEFDDSRVEIHRNMFRNQRTNKSDTAYLLTYRAVASSCGTSPALSERVLQTPESSRDRREMDSRRTSQKGLHMKKQQVVEQQRRHYGLRNHGNTCDLNSVLQVLNTPELHDSLHESLDSKLMKLFEDLMNETSGTETITSTLGIRNVYEQRDAAECLQQILQKLNPQVSKPFRGKETYTTKCTECHTISKETNPFWTLPLSLRDSDGKTFSVEEGFKKYFQPKTYSGDNMVHCNTCKKKTEATRKYEMDESPQILILLLMRFDFDDNTKSYVKSNRCVDVPDTLQVETKKKNKQYKLYGMVDHMGDLRDGHYTATIKSSDDKTWIEFDDRHVEIPENVFRNQRTYKSDTAYLLMYRGITNTHHPKRSVNSATELNESNSTALRRHNDEVRKNRHVLSRLIDCVKFSGVFESALRGKHESEGSSNPGGFQGLVDFVASFDNVLEKHLKTFTVSKGTLETMKNDLLDCMLAVTKERILEEVKSARFVAVQADVTTDVSTQTQLVLVLRYIDRNHAVQERFFEVLPISDATSKSISSVILERLQLLFTDDDKGKLIAQVYNGASVMREVFADVQQKVRKYYRNAHYVHGNAHQLNMDMQQATAHIPEARVFFSDFEGIALFLSHSSECLSILQQIVAQRLPGASTTGSDFNWRTMDTIYQNRDNLIRCFQSIRTSSSVDNTTVREASGLLRTLKDDDFQFFLKLFHQIMPHVDMMVQELQKNVNDLVSITRALQRFIDSVQTIRDQRQVSRWSVFGGQEEEKQRLTKEVCDTILSHTKERLAFTDPLVSATLLQPEMFERYCRYFPTEALDTTIWVYPMLNKAELKRELSNIYRGQEFRGCSGALELYQVILRFNLQEIFPETVTLLDTLITTPTTTAKAERCSSTFKRIKTSMQTATRQQHVNALAMLSMERELVRNMADFNERVIDRFAALEERRDKFQFK